MDQSLDGFSRREALGVFSAAVTVGISGCSGSGSEETPATTASTTATPEQTTTSTAPMDKPNIERQTVLRDKAAIPNIRWTVSGTVEWPEAEYYDRVQEPLLGRWEGDGEGLELNDGLTFSHTEFGEERSGTYETYPPSDFLWLTYDDGSEAEYLYEVTTEAGTTVLELYDTEGEYLRSLDQTVDGEDGRSTVVEVIEDFGFYAPDDAETNSRDLSAGATGSGFIVSPDGYVVTNAHVIGTDKDPEEQIYYQLAVETRQAIQEVVADDDFSESERQELTDILTTKLTDYYAEESTVSSVSTSIGVLSGTATPDEEFSAKSWSATVEKTGAVYESVDGETTKGRDIAILKVDVDHPLPTVRLGESTGLGTGAKVFIIGYPNIGVETLFTDRNTTLEPSLTSGVVSARRTLTNGVETIQTDAAINSGNSGGPVYNGDGEVVGVATFGPADSGIEDTGFALPIETATEFIDELDVEPEQSELSTTYQEGLNALWRDDCETVDEKMDAVLDIWPDHPYADDIVDQC